MKKPDWWNNYARAVVSLFPAFVLLMLFSYTFIAPVWDHNPNATGLRYWAMYILNILFCAAWYPASFYTMQVIIYFVNRKSK